MFDSGIKASDIIEQVKNEADIALSIDDKIYIQWLNAEEQLLYTEFIREQNELTLNMHATNTIEAKNLNGTDSRNAIRFEDIWCIYAGSIQLIKSTAASGAIFPNTYYKTGDSVTLNLGENAYSPKTIKIIYFVKPKLKTASNINSTNVMVPVEFIDLVKCKLRGEAYKLANEDELAAKWLNDYNVLLEDFKAWVANKQANFGM